MKKTKTKSLDAELFAIEELVEQIGQAQNKEELDALRLPIVQLGKGKEECFTTLQKAFIAQKAKIKRHKGSLPA